MTERSTSDDHNKETTNYSLYDTEYENVIDLRNVNESKTTLGKESPV